MAFQYFSKLPVIDYPISQTQTKRGRDILHRFFVDQRYAKMNEYLMQYRAEDGDALDVISAKLYKRADYHSIIMFINPAKGVFGGGLPVSSAVQEEYMDAVYGDTVHVLDPILPPAVIYDWAPVTPTFNVPEIKSKLESIRAEPYIYVSQNEFGGQLLSGVIDPSNVVSLIQGKYGSNPSGWGMLDFEIPFQSVLEAGPSTGGYATCVNSLVSTMEAVKSAFPRVRWTYYGFPGLSYYPGAGNLWAFASESARKTEIEKQILGFSPVLRVMDWYSPSVYDVFDQSHPAMSVGDAAQHNVNEREYRIARVGVVKEFLSRNGLGHRPILPAVSPFFAPGGGPSGVTLENKKIPFTQMVQDQILPLTEAGCNGVAIWSAADFYAAQALTGTDAGNSIQVRVRPIYTVDYFAGITPGDSGTPGWTAAATRTKLLTGLGNAVADMAVAAAGNSGLQEGRDIYPIFGYGLEEGETVFSWFPANPNQEVDTETAAVVREWNPRLMTVKLDQTRGSFPVGGVIGNESKTALFRVTKKIQEKDAVHHFEAIQDTFNGTPLKKGSIIDPLSAVYPVSGGVVLTPIGNPGICGGSTGYYYNSLVYLHNTIGIPPAISPYIKAVSNQEQEYRNIESNRNMIVPSNNPNLLEGLVTAVEEILDGVQR